jgi:hypothetical protein
MSEKLGNMSFTLNSDSPMPPKSTPIIVPFLTILSELGIKSGESTRPARSEAFFRDYANIIFMISPSQLTKGDAERAGWHFYEGAAGVIWNQAEEDSIVQVVDPETSVSRDVVSFITEVRTEWMRGGPMKGIDVPSTLRLDGGVSAEVKLAINPTFIPHHSETADVLQASGILDLRNFKEDQLETALLRVSLYLVNRSMSEGPQRRKINWVNGYCRPAYPAPDLSSLDVALQSTSHDEEIAFKVQPTMTSLLRLSTLRKETAELAVERLVRSALAGIFHVRGCQVLS